MTVLWGWGFPMLLLVAARLLDFIATVVAKLFVYKAASELEKVQELDRAR